MPTRRAITTIVGRQALLLLAGLIMTGTVLLIAHSEAPSNYVLPIPACDGLNGRPAHSLTTWHALVAYGPNGAVQCSYGHAHGARPDSAAMTNLFGALPQGQSISYPHATPNENLDSGAFPNKHRSYKWLTRIAPCPSGAQDPEITAFRVSTHMDGSLGAAVRFHSYWIQAELTNCATGAKGQFYGGGWIDQSYLIAGEARVALKNDPPAGCILNGDLRQEDSLTTYVYPLPNSVWYGASSRSDNGLSPVCDNNPDPREHWAFQMNQGIDQWGPVDPANPAMPLMYDPRSYRDSHVSEHMSSDGLSLLIPPTWSCPDGQTCAPVTGYSNSYGMVVSGCTTPGPQCVPFKRQNIPGDTASFTTFGIFAGDYDGAVAGPAPDLARDYYVTDPVGALAPGQTPGATATSIATAASTTTPAATATSVATSTSTPAATATSVATSTSTPAATATTTMTATPAATVTAAPTRTPAATPTRPAPTRTPVRHHPTPTPMPDVP